MMASCLDEMLFLNAVKRSIPVTIISNEEEYKQLQVVLDNAGFVSRRKGCKNERESDVEKVKSNLLDL